MPVRDTHPVLDVRHPHIAAVPPDRPAADVSVGHRWIILMAPDRVDVSVIDAALTLPATIVGHVPGCVSTDRGARPPARPRSRL